jgi:2-polyprenyl-6-methoxyphenol hydroxylase-like FAD-dependent oxidoreductase
LIAADGTKSKVREDLGIKMEGEKSKHLLIFESNYDL